jgi:hypothetical protein
MTDTTHVEGTPAHNNPEKPAPRVGRRKMILGVAAAGVGASVVAGAGSAGAEAPDVAVDVLLSKANKATATTSISMGVNGDKAVEGIDTSTGGGYGLYGTSKNGIGIYGKITGDTRGEYAIEGVDASTGSGGGAGIGGSSTKGTGVLGTSTNGAGVYGVHGTGSGSGVLGEDNSGNAASNGVYGSSDIGYGVQGHTTGEMGTGLYGLATGAMGSGVQAQNDGEDGYGVYAEAFGVGSYGVYAFSQNADALYVDGSATVTGNLSKGGGSFKIDHPVDPQNKYLYHSFVESPDMMNVYNGTATLDGRGEATVELPDWFEALNRDYRYQLTAIGSPAPELHISRKVEDGKFSIAGGKARQEVSWQVTGIRQDAWANANRIPVEVDKKAQDQGRYLHPELFGGEAITALAKARDRSRRGRHMTPA